MDNLVAAVTTAILSLLPHWTSTSSHERAREYAAIIVEETQSSDPRIDPFLVVAIVFKESSFRAKVKGKRGEVGLMQILPRGSYTQSIAKDSIADARENIRIGVAHLRYWLKECGTDDTAVWLSAYNSGKCGITGYSKRVLSLHRKIAPEQNAVF